MWRGAVSGGKAGRPSICHCRMCQKQFGSFFGALVTADQAHLTGRAANRSSTLSAKVKRGFCEKCGTPLTYQHAEGVELAIGAFDNRPPSSRKFRSITTSACPGSTPCLKSRSMKMQIRKAVWAGMY